MSEMNFIPGIISSLPGITSSPSSAMSIHHERDNKGIQLHRDLAQNLAHMMSKLDDITQALSLYFPVCGVS